MNNSTRIYTGITLVPQTTTAVSAAGDLRYNTSSNKLELFNTGVDSVVTETLAATLTNKTLTGNTAVKLISGSGTLVLNTSGTITAPNGTDTLAGLTLSQTLTNKTIAAGSNTITGLTNTNLSGSAAISNANLAAMAANTVKANSTGGSATPTDVSLVSTATASAVVIRDTNANAGLNNSLHGFQTVTSAAGTTTLTVASPYATQVTGSANQTVVLPSATTLTVGQSFTILNRSTGVVTVNANGGSLVQTMLTITQAIFTVTDISTSAGVWDSAYSASSGLDINRNFSANNFIPSIASITSAASTTTLTVASAFEQYVTGSTTQAVQLPVASTLANGQGYQITNNSSGLVTVKTSGGTTLATLTTSTTVLVSCINTAGGTGSASWNTTFLGGGAAIAPTVQKFLSGSGTYTTPAGVIYLDVKMVGGGGGGSGSSTQAAANASGGGNGTATTFGSSLLTAGGGSGSGFLAQGGIGGTNTINAPAISVVNSIGNGGPGTSVYNGTNGIVISSAFGGGSAIGGGVPGTYNQSTGTSASANTGAGGGGAGINVAAGEIIGGGGGGGGYIQAVIPSPSASYSYSVGPGGSGGSAGTSGSAGGAGGSGYLVITEFYANGASGNGGAIPPTAQRLTSGSGTYTTPANVTFIKVRMAGAGGGGGGSGAGSGSAGGTGGTTTFGSSLLTAVGGNGGNGGVSGGGGGASGGSVTISAPAIAVVSQTGGTSGGATNNISGANLYTMGSNGGTNPLGGAGMNGAAAAAGSAAIANTGAGGGGGTSAGVANAASGAGGGAGGYLEAIIFSPSASYSYSIGAAGTAGTAGTSGNGGGLGGSGVIIVEEYYANGAIGTATNVTGIVAVANGGTGVNGPVVGLAYKNGVQSIPNSTHTLVTLDTVTYDTTSAWNTGTSKYTPLVAGYYQVSACVGYTTSSGFVLCEIYKNGSVVANSAGQTGAGATICTPVSTIVQMNGTTDFIQLFTYQTSGAGANLTNASNFTFLSAHKI